MKRVTGLFPQVYDYANLESAYRKARRCKRYHNEVLRFSANKEERLIDIQNHLMWKTYEQGQYRTFIVTEPKRRTISALPFRDRVMHHAVNNILEPILDRRFYAHSYACRKGKGMHEASAVLTGWLRNLSFEGRKVYALKCDIHSYFQSISHDKLKAALRRVIKDEDMLWLLDMIIDSNGADTGIPIGNLSSQLFANFYLDALDKFIKEELHARHYIRYMDDFIILSHDKQYLREAWKAIDDFVTGKLNLQLNPKTAIVAAKNGIYFCGFRHWADHKRVRRTSVRRMQKVIHGFEHGKIEPARFDRSLQSWLGHIGHADSYGLKQTTLKRIAAIRERSTQ